MSGTTSPAAEVEAAPSVSEVTRPPTEISTSEGFEVIEAAEATRKEATASVVDKVEQ